MRSDGRVVDAKVATGHAREAVTRRRQIPKVGELWRSRHGSGDLIHINEVTDVTVRYHHDGYETVFGQPLATWGDTFEPCPTMKM